MIQLNKRTLGNMAKELGFVRDTLEKVIRLTRILEFIESDELLSKRLALKGGTAINLTIFVLPRLSVDIDLDYSGELDRNLMLSDRKIIKDKIRKYMNANGYMLSDKSKEYYALDSFVFEYINFGGVKDNLKIEINYMLRCHILPEANRMILLPWMDSPLNVYTLSIVDIFAAKGNALINRAAARDLFDWNNMIERGLFDGEENLFRKALIFYNTISSEKVNKNFDTSEIDTLTFLKIKRDLFPMINNKANFDLEGRKAKAKQYIAELMILTNNEKEYLERFIAKEYRPELLFDDEKILARIKDHPMALWKCRQ